MPLLPGKKNIGYNIREMMHAGHPQDQSIAAAYRAAGEKKSPGVRKTKGPRGPEGPKRPAVRVVNRVPLGPDEP